MTVKQRILAIRLLEKQNRDPEYAKRIGVQVSIRHRSAEKDKGKT